MTVRYSLATFIGVSFAEKVGAQSIPLSPSIVLSSRLCTIVTRISSSSAALHNVCPKICRFGKESTLWIVLLKFEVVLQKAFLLIWWQKTKRNRSCLKVLSQRSYSTHYLKKLTSKQKCYLILVKFRPISDN